MGLNMEFQLYKERIFCFRRVFSDLKDCVKPGVMIEDEQEFKQNIRAGIHNPLDSFERQLFIERKGIGFGDLAGFLPALQAVDLLADMETIKQQAEALKNEIINHCSHVKKMMYQNRGDILIETTPIGPVSIPWYILFVDFIRNQSEEIIYPFDYWEDCVEVYMMKHIDGLSNKKIGERYQFKSSAVRGGRQGEGLVARCLEETERIMGVIRNNDFPPLIMQGTKQPTLI